jgi:transposase, IS5 family
MKAHVGTDRRGIVHTLTTTPANVADINEMHKLLHGKEKEVFGDQAYWSESHRQAAGSIGVRYRVNRRPNGHTALSTHQKLINRIRSRARARCEHAFQVVKHLWGFTKVRYRGLAKNTARLFTAFCTGESVPAAPKVDATAGKVSVVRAEQAHRACQHAQDSSDNCLREASR